MGRVQLAFGCLVTAFAGAMALTALCLMSAASGAPDRDILGDWVIEGTTVSVDNETIDVRGRVVVEHDGTLIIDNCTLLLNSTTSGRYAFFVNRSGHLEATCTTFSGRRGVEQMGLFGEASFRGCRISRLMGDMNENLAVICGGGETTFLDTTFEDINGGCLYAGSVVSLSGCTIQRVSGGGIAVGNHWASDRVSVDIRSTRVLGPGKGSWGPNGIWVRTFTGGREVILTVSGSLIQGWNFGMLFELKDTGDVMVQGCDIRANYVGLGITQWHANITLKDNDIGNQPGPGSYGIAVLSSSDWLTMAGNLVEWVETGYYFKPITNADEHQSWSGLNARNCTRGVQFEAEQEEWCFMEVHNSTFYDIIDPQGTFVAYDRVFLRVYDTVHAPGSATVIDGASELRGYRCIYARGARWLDGPAIIAGDVVIEGGDSTEVARLNLSSPVPVQVLGWSVTGWWARSVTWEIVPVMTVEGHRFTGPSVPLWNVTTANWTVEITDDEPPAVAIAIPSENAIFNSDGVAARGTFEELGSGLASLLYRVDASGPSTMAGPQNGVWQLFLLGLGEGTHELAIAGVDACGNEGEPATVRFIVDMLPPLLDLSPMAPLVNRTELELSGRTEPGSTLTVNDVQHPVGADGSFSVKVPLFEGRNYLRVRAIDVAGNVNSTLLMVTCDTTPPELVVTSPADGSWTIKRTVLVEGSTAIGATVRVNGHEDVAPSGTFSCELDLAEGPFSIDVWSRDGAGNTAEAHATVLVDWTPPRLEVLSPEAATTYVTQGRADIMGEVYDRNPVAVTVNGLEVACSSGRFLEALVLTEGVHDYEVVARDAAGNTASLDLTIVMDATPPEADYELIPVDGRFVEVGGRTLSSTPQVRLVIKASEVVIVQLGDRTLGPSRSFSLEISLAEGENAVLAITRDMAGNAAAQLSEVIVVDTVTPPLEVTEPRPGLTTLEGSLRVVGTTEAGLAVTVNGVAQRAGADGRFEAYIPLVEGPNSIVVTVTDGVGWTNGTTMEVVRERRAGLNPEVARSGLVIAVLVALAATGVVLARIARGRGGGGG